MKLMYFITLTLSLTLISSLFLVYSNTMNLLADQDEPQKMLVYLQSTFEVNDSAELVQFLKNDRRIDRFSIQSKEETLSSFNASFPEYAQGIKLSEDILSIIPTIVEVNFKSTDDSGALIQSLKSFAGVTEVQSHFYWLDRLMALKNISLNFLLLLFGFFAFVLITITVLLAHKFVLNEKDKLQIYSFCGASQKQIFKLLFSKFYLISFFGIVSGLILSFGLYLALKAKIASLDLENLITDRLHFLTTVESFVLVCTFVMIVYVTITLSAKSALKEVWNDD